MARVLRVAIGVGCRRDCPCADIVAIVRDALAAIPGDTVSTGLFTVFEKAGEPGLRAASHALALPLIVLDRAVLGLVAGGARSCSRRVEDMFGLPGIAETAALAGAGQGATLLVPKRSNATASCAIAICEDAT